MVGYYYLPPWAFQAVLVVKNPPANMGDIRDVGSTPGSGRSPGGGPGNPLQYSCLENPRGQRSLAGYNPWGRKESDTTEQLSTHTQGTQAGPGRRNSFQAGTALLSAIRKPATGPTTTPALRDIHWQGLGLVAAFHPTYLGWKFKLPAKASDW